MVEEVRRITGRHPNVIIAKTNNAKMGLRKGDACGVKANMEGQLMCRDGSRNPCLLDDFPS